MNNITEADALKQIKEAIKASGKLGGLVVQGLEFSGHAFSMDWELSAAFREEELDGDLGAEGYKWLAVRGTTKEEALEKMLIFLRK